MEEEYFCVPKGRRKNTTQGNEIKDERKILLNEGSISFPINKAPYDKQLYSYDTLTLKSGFYVLVGHNGAGKTTLLGEIEKRCIEDNVPIIHYDNYTQGGRAAIAQYGASGDMQNLATSIMASEGEQIFNNFGNAVAKVGQFMRRNQDKSHVVVMFDALDSGLDVDGIDQVKDIAQLVLDDNKDKTVVILCSTNNYSLVKGSQCLDVKTGQVMTFDKYEDFEGFIKGQYKTLRESGK